MGQAPGRRTDWREQMTFFGDELRRLRRASGLSQETLAARAGLSPEAVSLLERGRRSPRVTTMRLLSDAMDLGEDERASLFASISLAEPAAPRLPVFTDPLLGRDADLAAVADLLDREDARLVTLHGPAGVGKSRIAIAYAARQPSPFPGGVHWLPLGSVPDRAGMIAALAASIGLRGSRQSSLADVVDHLRGHASLLVVDDAEHRLADCAELCRAALADDPALTIMVASRHLTGVAGEIAYPVSPLETPPAGTGVERLKSFPACDLFLARAAAVGDLDQAAADAVVRICQRLDGLPLALELAAARTDVLTVHELAEALDDELAILTSPGPTGERDLGDTMVGWSYELLTPQEREVFSQLSVFGEGFTRDAVAAVCGEAISGVEVVQVLSSLVSKSLVERRDDGSAQARFRLLHLIRQYARERLAEGPDEQPVRHRHAEYYCTLVEHLAAQTNGGDEALALTRLDRELIDLSEAISWACLYAPEVALRIVAGLSRWVYMRGRYGEGRRWAACALASWPDAPPELRAPVLALAGSLAFLQCDYAEATVLIEEALALHRSQQNLAGVVWATSRLGSVARELGEYERADELHRSALAMAEEAGDASEVATQLNFLCFLTWIRGDLAEAEPLGRDALTRMRDLGDAEGMIWTLVNLGVVARYRGDLVAADLLLSQSLERCEELSFREGLGWALNQLGAVARLAGEPERALGLQQAALIEHQALGDRWREASTYDELAALAVGRQDFTGAAAHLASGDRLRREIRAPLPAVERADRERTVQQVQEAFGSGFEATALAAGLDLPPT